MKTLTVTAALLATVALAAPAHAQMVNPSDPSSVANAMQAIGYRAKMDTDAVGDPMILTTIDGSRASVMFYGCSNNENCKSLVLRAAFAMADGPSHENLGDWNRRNYVGRAYLDSDKDPVLDMALPARGSLPSDTFEHSVELFEMALNSFKNDIGWE